MDEDFVNQTMLTCLGNKRKLVKDIYNLVKELSIKLNKDKLNILDGFSGSCVVSRALSSLANNIHTNDLELYSYLMAKCNLKTPNDIEQNQIINHIKKMNEISKNGPYYEYGIISKLYAPKDTHNIQEDERVFYTRENALIIDTLRKYIDDNVEKKIQPYCLVPLLNKASIHSNTAGVFKGFYKGDNNIGKFGGKAENCLSRIMKPIELDTPIWSKNDFKSYCYNEDINKLIRTIPGNLDVIYLDPPYNQHPYGSNYFMLNVIAENIEPKEISKVAGIPKEWNKSDYNKSKSAKESMKHLLDMSLKKSKYVIISYNNEGIIKLDDWNEIFEGYDVEKKEIVYDTYKGSRNLKERDNKVIEIMYIVKNV